MACSLRSGVIGIIPARAGSKGIPNKNIREIRGMPLIAHTIKTAILSEALERVIVSTESEEIARIAIKWGAEVPFLRPDDLASDTADSVSVANHVLENIEQPKSFLWLQPTSPLRSVDDIRNIIKVGKENNRESVVSVTILDKPKEWQVKISKSGMIEKEYDINGGGQRQDFEDTYIVNGALYYCKTAWFQSNQRFVGPQSEAFIMPRERSIDIDCELEWLLAEALLGRTNDKGIGDWC